MQRLRVPFFVMLFWIVGCNSMHKKAESLMEGGAYADAIATYEAILQKDPNDEDAVLGLKRAREKFIDESLLKVRKSRLGGSPDQAAELLYEILASERAWGMTPMGAALYTQNEEMREGQAYIVKEARNAIQSKLPARSAYLLTRYESFFSEARANRDALYAQTLQLGKQTCRDWQKLTMKGKHYFGEFLSEFCHYFKEPVKLTSTQLGKDDRPLYRDVQVKSQLVALPPRYVPQIQSVAKEALASTGWYAPSGGPLTIRLSGEYSVQTHTQPIMLYHAYTEQEPYSDFDRVKRTYSTVDPATGATKYVDYYESVPVTRFRPVAKTFPYTATEYHQSFSIAFHLQTLLAGSETEASIRDGASHVTTEHNNSMGQIGLYPQKAQLISEDEWTETQIARLGTEFQRVLTAQWMQQFCRGEGNGDFTAMANAVQRCLAQPQEAPPGFAEAWYRQNLGIGIAAAQTLFAKK